MKGVVQLFSCEFSVSVLSFRRGWRWKTLGAWLCPEFLAVVGLLRGVEALPPLVLDDKHGLSGEIVRL